MAPSGEQYPQSSDAGAAAPPPPPDSLYTQPVQQFSYYPPQSASPQSFTPAPPNYDALPQSPPNYAQPQKDSSKSVLGQIGCGVLVIILLLVGACVGPGDVGYRWVESRASSTAT